MKETLQSFKADLREVLHASELVEAQTVQELWSGYGTIKRYRVEGGRVDSVIIKHVSPPTAMNHPRGWNSNRSHKRKIRSYEVESAWYSKWSSKCSENCRVPTCYATEATSNEFFIALEDLNTSGFDLRKSSISFDEMKSCMRWLAHFHATFLNVQQDDLWKVGTYWHLDTRPDEFSKIKNKPLKYSAKVIDELLQQSKFQTLVHGDAKLANFCFSSKSQDVAAIDFQYVGGGCGMKDLAYFVGSCLSDEECEKREQEILSYYFGILRDTLREKCPEVNFQDLREDWTALYPVAWADFQRFLEGWSPDHWKLTAYSQRLTKKVIESLTL